jgi:TPR repeat protein
MKAAEKNFPRALNNLATFYFNSKSYNNPKKCLEYLERASEAEYVKSLHNLALIYIEGTMVNVDEVKGMNLLKRAAQKGDIEARILYVERMLNEAAKCSEDDLV